MRVVARVLGVLGAVVAYACGGSAAMLTAPPPSELALAVTMSPDPAGGMRPSTLVSAMLFLEPVATRVVTGSTLASAEFAVFDGQGALLARETVAGPLAFEPNGTLTVRKALDWMPAETLGRSLRVRFVLPAGATLLERTLTF